MARPIGSFAQAMFESVRRAEVMQAQALEYIHTQFEAEPEIETLEGLTWEAFIEEREAAFAAGTMDALNAKYARLLQPFIDMVMAEQQQGAQ